MFRSVNWKISSIYTEIISLTPVQYLRNTMLDMSVDWSGISSFYDEEARSWPVENKLWPEPCLLLSEV